MKTGGSLEVETVEDVRIGDEVVDIDDDGGSGKDVASGSPTHHAPC